MRLIDADALTQAFLNNDVDDFGLINQATTIQSFTLEDIEEQYRKRLEKGLSEWETERPQSEWIRKGNETNFWYECDKCGCEPYYSHSIRTIKFCPNCGAKMKGDEE